MLLLPLALAAEPASPTEPAPLTEPAPTAEAAPATSAPPAEPASPAPADPAPAVPEPVPSPDCADDQRFLDALLLLHSDQPDTGIAALVLAADARAVPVLDDVVRVRRDGAVAEAAVVALARFPEGTAPLSAWVLDPALPKATRVVAARALGSQGTPAAGDALVRAAGDRAVSGSVREEVMATLTERFPDRLAGLARPSERGGVAWTMVGGATGLGYGLATAGHFGQTRLEALGALAGGAGGLTGGWAYARRRPVTAGDASFVTLSQWAGGAGAILVTSAFDLGDDPTGTTMLAGLGGALAGTGVGIGLARVHPGSGGDAWEELAVTAAGMATVSTLMNFAQAPGQTTQVATGLATVGGFAGAAAAAPHVKLEATDIGFVGLGAAWGTATGALMPLPQGTYRSGLPVGLTGLGGLAAWGLAPVYQRPADELLGGFVGLGTGSALGAGVGLLLQADSVSNVPAVVGGTGGLATGLVLANRDPAGIDGTDLVWAPIATGWVAFQTLGWGSLYDLPNGEGWSLTLVGAAGTASAVGSRWVDIPYTASLTMASTGVWGVYMGAAVSELVDADPLRGALIGGDVGLLAGSASLFPRFEVAPAVLGLADAGGVVVGGTSTLVAALLTTDPDVLLATSLVGSGVGMVGGGLLGSRLKPTGPVSLVLPRVDPPGEWGVAPLYTQVDEHAVVGATVTGVGW